MSTQFVPGPWKANGRYVSGGPTDRNIAHTTELRMTNLIKQSEEYERACANAQLIAAAPEMLDTLKWVAQTVHQAHHDGPLETCPKNTCSAAVATIAKAEGQA